MPKYTIFLLTFILLISFNIPLLGDIIITNDDMILNGKILEDKKGAFIKFGNYHGIFTIDYRQIKELHRTERYEDDVKIFIRKGKKVNESEVKTNYQSGLKKLEDQGGVSDKSKKEAAGKETVSLLVSPFYNFNTGKLSGELPYSLGVSVAGHIQLNQFDFLKEIYLSGIAAELAYFYSKKGVKQVSGTRLSAGPFWQFPVSIGTFNFNYCVSPEIGAGFYKIRGTYDETSEVKYNLLFSTGPVFNFSSVLFYPSVKFDYIYDGNVPLYGIGISIAAGYKF